MFNTVRLEILTMYKDKNRKFLISLLCCLATLQSGLRDIDKLPLGNDTPVYASSYRVYSLMSWGDLLRGFTFYTGDYEERDLGFPLFVKFTQLFVDDFRFYMFLTAIIFIIPFGTLIYRYVKSYWGIVLSFLIYFVLYSNIVNCFMRQAITLGIVLWGVRYILSSEWKKYFILLALAFTIHSSAILAVPLYFLPKLNLSKKWLLLCICASPIFIFNSQYVLSYLASGSVYENYVDRDSKLPINYILYLTYSAFLAYVFFDRIRNVANSKLIIAGVFGSILLLPLVAVGNTVLRISYYYTLFLIPLISLILENINVNQTTRTLLYICCIIFFSMFII